MTSTTDKMYVANDAIFLITALYLVEDYSSKSPAWKTTGQNWSAEIP
jgi:hypothetical protein